MSPSKITQMLVEWGNGRREVLHDLMPLVYDELRAWPLSNWVTSDPITCI